jgi:molybdopterin molybdotransferase
LADRARVEDAAAWIDAHAAALGREDVPVAEAAGRVLCEAVPAEVDLPPFDLAAVDGFAVRAEETVGASAYNPLRFRLAADAGDLPAGGAVRLEAGDRLPRGADAMVPLGHVEPVDAGACAIVEPAVAGNEVERAGSHSARGSVLLASRRRLGPGDIGMLAAAGHARAGVVRRPRVCCMTRGDRIEVDANGLMLRALIERDGAILAAPSRANPEGEVLRDALEPAGADLVVLVGRDDRAAEALTVGGGGFAIDGVALRPGGATGIGRTAAGVPVFRLPVAAVACYWAYEFFAGRAIRLLGGRSPALPFGSRTATVARKIVSEIGTTEIVPVQCAGPGEVEPMASFAEAGLGAVTQADGFVVVPESSEGYQRGATVTVYLLR